MELEKKSKFKSMGESRQGARAAVCSLVWHSLKQICIVVGLGEKGYVGGGGFVLSAAINSNGLSMQILVRRE